MELLDQITERYRAKLAERRRRLIAELYEEVAHSRRRLEYANRRRDNCGKPEVSGEVAKADVGKVVNIAAFHRDNQK